MAEARSCPYCLSVEVTRAGFSRVVPSFRNERRQIFQCKTCKKRFSIHVRSIFYRLKKNDPALNQKIFQLCLRGLSNRAIGEVLSVSEHLVRIRIERLSRQALFFHANLMRDKTIREPVCFDGLENFAGSQYDPNNIQQAIGRDSLFIYDFNFASLNRKGRMSEWQKRRLREIEDCYGRYNPKSIRSATYDLLRRLIKRWDAPGEFTLLSDEHFQYRKVVNVDLRKEKISHVTINSKACRNFQNILFSVNHADLVIRQKLAAFSRETISFSKTAGAMCQKYALFMTAKNYMAPQFTKKHVRRPDAHEKSPAEKLGFSSGMLTFADIFYKRSTSEDQKILSHDWKCFWQGKVPRKHGRHPKFVRPSKEIPRSLAAVG